VTRAAEFPAGVERGENELGRRTIGVLGTRAGGDPPTVVLHPTATIGQDGHVDLGAVPGHGLVDGVVDDLPDQVVQSRGTGGTDVHARTLPDRLQTLENCDVAGVVRRRARLVRL